MKKIRLTRGKFALVDDQDYEELNKVKWHATLYPYAARRNPDNKNGAYVILMHRVILNAKQGQEVDHINHNPLDNRRENIRLTNKSGNACNRGKSAHNTSGFKGVSWNKKAGKWRANIKLNGVQKHLGIYSNKRNAHAAYWDAAQDFHGEFAHP